MIALKDADKRAKEWCDVAMNMINELRMDYAPGVLGELDGVRAIRALRRKIAAQREALEAARRFAGSTFWLDKAEISDRAQLCVMHDGRPYDFGLTLGDIRRLVVALAKLDAARKE